MSDGDVFHEGGRRGGNATGARNRAKTHCLRGHEFTEENTRLYGNERHCRACARVRGQKRQDAKLLKKKDDDHLSLIAKLDALTALVEELVWRPWWRR